jgi:hypothetical protein
MPSYEYEDILRAINTELDAGRKVDIDTSSIGPSKSFGMGIGPAPAVPAPTVSREMSPALQGVLDEVKRMATATRSGRITGKPVPVYSQAQIGGMMGVANTIAGMEGHRETNANQIVTTGMNNRTSNQNARLGILPHMMEATTTLPGTGNLLNTGEDVKDSVWGNGLKFKGF